MRARKVTRFKVTPTNIKNGNTAPYSIVEIDGRAKKDEVEKIVMEQYKNTALARFSNWQPSIDKI